MEKDRLIPNDMAKGSLQDLDALLVIARNIENAYSQVGAIPGEDYTYNELMNLAMQFICRDNTKYSVENHS